MDKHNKPALFTLVLDRLDNKENPNGTHYYVEVLIVGANWVFLQYADASPYADFEVKGKGLRALAKKLKAHGYALAE